MATLRQMWTLVVGHDLANPAAPADDDAVALPLKTWHHHSALT